MDKIERDIERLNQQDWSIWEPAMKRLGKSDDQRAKDALIKLLDHEDRSHRSSAIRIIGIMKEIEAVPKLISMLDQHPWDITDALGEIGDPRAVPAIIDKLKDQHLYRHAASAIGNIGVSEEQFQLILDMLKNSSIEYERTGAAIVLGIIKRTEAVPSLIHALNDKESVIIEAATALGNIGERKALPALFDAIESENYFIANRCAQAIGKIGVDDEQFCRLETMLKQGKIAAAEALGNLKNEKAARALVEVFGQENLKGNEVRCIKKIRKEAVDAVIPALNDPDLRVQRRAAEILGKIGDKRGTPSLIIAIGQKDAIKRRKAIEALGRIKDFAAIPALISATRDKNAICRKNAIIAIGRIKSVHGVVALVTVLGDPNPHLRFYAFRGLNETLKSCKTMDEVKAFETNLQAGFREVAEKRGPRYDKIGFVIGDLMAKCGRKKDKLVSRISIRLDDIPKPGKGTAVFRALGRQTIS